MLIQTQDGPKTVEVVRCPRYHEFPFRNREDRLTFNTHVDVCPTGVVCSGCHRQVALEFDPEDMILRAATHELTGVAFTCKGSHQPGLSAVNQHGHTIPHLVIAHGFKIK
jgi:hypothetical protein